MAAVAMPGLAVAPNRGGAGGSQAGPRRQEWQAREARGIGGSASRRAPSGAGRRAIAAPRSAAASGEPEGGEAVAASPSSGPSPLARLLPRWLVAAPRVRVRSAAERPLAQLAELAVLNERLEGRQQPWEVRQKLDYFQKSKAHWEAICQGLLDQDATATLRSIEEAQAKVDRALSEEFRDGNSVTDLRVQLQELQVELESAHKSLHDTQGMVSKYEQQVQQLQQEAEKLRALATVEIPEPAAVTTVEQPSSKSRSKEVVAAGAARRAEAKKKSVRTARRLSSSLELEEGLREYWYPVEFSANLCADKLVPVEIFSDMFVLFRDEQGRAACVVDECAHRACPLSLGSVVDGRIQCPYHGWEYDGAGACTKMPSTVHCKGVEVRALAVEEADGLIWVWGGACAPYRDIPDVGRPPAGHVIHSELVLEVPVEHGLLVENLLDLAHAPFTHTSTFARGWQVPEAVRFRMMSMLGGEWDPYPIDMSFEPPCITLSTIGLQKPGQVERGARAADCAKHLRQMHVCLPSKPGHTRLLYRMSLDFLPILKRLPFMDAVWKEMANRVLGEDLVLVQGQQRRMQLGGDTWANPVSYDKLAVRYRRWRNSLVSGDHTEKAAAAAALRSNMSAGELFSMDEAESESFIDADAPSP